MELMLGSEDILVSTLATLRHLDQSGHVRYVSAVMKKHGGYCDVFLGYLQVDVYRELMVAIKRLRVHVQGNRDSRKVSLSHSSLSPQTQ